MLKIQNSCQRFIYKIKSSRLRKERWNLKLSVREARNNDEVIALADSQILRWIDSINGVEDVRESVAEIKREIRRLRSGDPTIQSGRRVRTLYDRLDKLQFVPDYMCLVIERKRDYYRACDGFKINGVTYKRLLGTSGGIKNSTIVFVSDRVIDELRRRIENDRDQSKELVTAKLEAYKGLTCSSSTPVSFPHGVLVVDDVVTEFNTDYIYLSDDTSCEPTIETRTSQVVTLDASDGYGLMLPSLAERWSDELGLGYVSGGFNTRYAFEKGVVVAFDFVEFAETVSENYFVRDAWGNNVDIRDVELVLTTSMVKLWDSYSSCEDYISKSAKNGYSFCVTKTCPDELENERSLNYQFIQSYDLSDEDIDELIAPTIDEINDVIGGDWRKTILFLCGSKLNDSNVESVSNPCARAIMADPHVLDDPHVRKMVYQQIKNRIDRAKCGVISVHGNYSIITGDPFLLCQSMFGMKKTGLLKSGEIYNEYWANTDAEKLACFRAPMTCHNNIRIVTPARGARARYWFRYMRSSTVLNGWDTSMYALNGADFDGDQVMLTDNDVLIRRHVDMPALVCVQRKAGKRISTEEDFVKSNIDSFGNEIGQTTNWITSMFEVRAGFDCGSKEYDELTYRIMCGQLFQQNAIDKAKGIVAKPMPRWWHDRAYVRREFSGEERERLLCLAADKKPYFMRYIYPALSKQYNTFVKNTNEVSLRKFGKTVAELRMIPFCELTDDQANFLDGCDRRNPVGTNLCVMNKICKRIEEEFDGCIVRYGSSVEFDYNFMKTGASYSHDKFREIERLYNAYNRRIRSYTVRRTIEAVDPCEAAAQYHIIDVEFKDECERACPDSSALCDIVLDLCYTKSSSKNFTWNMCGDDIAENLRKRNGGVLRYPVADESGDIVYGGNRYRIATKRIW